jgi:hypothetical protein
LGDISGATGIGESGLEPELANAGSADMFQ